MSTTASLPQTNTNANKLLWAGFTAILAAGMGFAIRGGIFDNWERQFGFSASQTGTINGASFTSFCFGIIIGGMVVDKIGYGKLVGIAFVLHVTSALVAFVAAIFDSSQQIQAFNALFISTFLFGLANGTLEAVANPLVATLFPHNRTHYLNILHASWPLGMVLGGVIGWILDERFEVPWVYQLVLFLIPTAVYGFMFFGKSYPKSEASAKGLRLGEMFGDVGILGSAVIGLFIGLFVKDGLGDLLSGLFQTEFFHSTAWTVISVAVGIVAWVGFSGLSGFSTGAVLLFVLFLTHILVGAVELGTDSWIQNIEGNLLTPQQGRFLFVFTSLMMFVLRFGGHFIEHTLKLSPVALLLVSAILGCIGLNLVGSITTFSGALLALTVYGVGKTFFWPTMLAVASDRFPRTGAIAISIMGGLGMMSAGLVGSKGLGYAKDRFASEALVMSSPAVYEANKAQELDKEGNKKDKKSSFLLFKDVTPIDGQRIGVITKKVEEAKIKNSDLSTLNLSPEELALQDASIKGDRKTLQVDSFIPATMAVIYLLLLIYFASIGGYKRLSVHDEENIVTQTYA